MKLHSNSLGLAGGILYGVVIFMMTMLAIVAGVGKSYMDLMVGLLPFYSVSMLGSIVGFVGGFTIGYVFFYVLGMLYNFFEGQ